MNLLVFGASGKTGREVVAQALEKGHQVSAVVRNPATMKITSRRLQIVAGDATRPASFQHALRNQDAVLSVLGISSFWKSLQPMTFHRDTAQNIVDQMMAENTSRLICVTSIGVTSNPSAPFWYKAILKPLLRHKYADMQAMEQIVRNSDLEWTVVRPFRLTNGKETGQYRVSDTGTLPKGSAISRADLAALLLHEAETGKAMRKTLAVAY